MILRLLILLTGYLWGCLFLTKPLWRAHTGSPAGNPDKGRNTNQSANTGKNPDIRRRISLRLFLKCNLKFIIFAILSLVISFIAAYISYETQLGYRFIPYSALGCVLGLLFPLFRDLRYKQKAFRIIFPIFLSIINLYIVLVNGALNAALIPAFMRRLDAFEELTVKNYSEQVQTQDIKDNAKDAYNETKEWLKGALYAVYLAKSEDGYSFDAAYFPSAQDASFDELGNVIPKDSSTASSVQLSHKWAVLLHGYTGWKEAMYEYAKYYVENGYNVLVPDLRCCGSSEGDFIGMGLTDAKDVNEIWISYILKKDPNAQIVLHGQSMGAATALIMSGDNTLPANVKAIVSDAAYTDAYSMFGDKAYKWFSLPPFPIVDSACLMLVLRGGYNLKEASPIDAVSQSHTPTLFMHGSMDAMIDVSMASQLFDSATCKKELQIFEGSGHAQNQDKDPELFYGTITSFLSKYISD